MHRALDIKEILYITFSCCSRGGLAALARTCRAFKDPALDVLWRALYDLSPLARSLPEASHYNYKEGEVSEYSFSRSLTQTEWNALQSYTRRIYIILNFENALSEKSFEVLSHPPTGVLFPNLRRLRCQYTDKIIPLLRLPLPSLTSFDVEFSRVHVFQKFLEWFPPSYDSSTRFIHVKNISISPINIQLGTYIPRWQNLHTMLCPGVILDVDALVHLSCTPALTFLEFFLSPTLPVFGSSLVFSNLQKLSLGSISSDSVVQLLSQTRFPVITEFSVTTNMCPLKQGLVALFTCLLISNPSHTIEHLHLFQVPRGPGSRSEKPLLHSKDLQLCTAFSNLRVLGLDIEWNIDLTGGGVLELASAWPKLEHIIINTYHGWHLPRGITPGELIQLLQKCPSLNQITLQLDTQDYTEVALGHGPASLGLTLPPDFFIDLVDSVIEAESAMAVATFLSGLATCCESGFSFVAWEDMGLTYFLGDEAHTYRERWDDVHRRFDELRGCSKSDDLGSGSSE